MSLIERLAEGTGLVWYRTVPLMHRVTYLYAPWMESGCVISNMRRVSFGINLLIAF